MLTQAVLVTITGHTYTSFSIFCLAMFIVIHVSPSHFMCIWASHQQQYLAPPWSFTWRWPASKEHPVPVSVGCPVASAPSKTLMARVIPPAEAVAEPWPWIPLSQ